MPRFIVKLTDKNKKKDYFILWSTIVDSAVGHFKGLREATMYLKKNLSTKELDRSLKSLMKNGTSNPYYSIKDVLDCNTENCETVEDLIEKYCDFK